MKCLFLEQSNVDQIWLERRQLECIQGRGQPQKKLFFPVKKTNPKIKIEWNWMFCEESTGVWVVWHSNVFFSSAEVVTDWSLKINIFFLFLIYSWELFEIYIQLLNSKAVFDAKRKQSQSKQEIMNEEREHIFQIYNTPSCVDCYFDKNILK